MNIIVAIRFKVDRFANKAYILCLWARVCVCDFDFHISRLNFTVILNTCECLYVCAVYIHFQLYILHVVNV